MSARRVIDLLVAQSNANRSDPQRNGQMLHLPAAGDLVIAGDIHNHTRNFERVRGFANLAKNPKRIVILQELIHGGPLGPSGQDTSFEMLLDAISWAQEFPGRVHFLLANHDLAQVQHTPVMKDGYDLTDRFTRHIQLKYSSDAPAVTAAMQEFVLSQALAAISASGLFFSHSLPATRDMATFDTSILRRQLTEADYQRGGSVHQLIWGRRQTPDVLASLSKAWWADAFVCGHQQQDMGFGVIEPSMMIIDSSHNHGVLLRLDLSRPYNLGSLRGAVVPLASLV